MGDIDDYLSIKLYEEEDRIHSAMNKPLIESLLAPQITAEDFPDGIMAPDKFIDFQEYDDTTSHTLYFWDNKHLDFKINLLPCYRIQNFIFVFCKWPEICSFHEIHALISPIAY